MDGGLWGCGGSGVLLENEASLRISVAKMGGYLRLHVLVRGAGTKRAQAIIGSIPYSAVLNAAFITCENSNGWPRDCKVGSASLSQDFLPDSDLGVEERQRKPAYQAGMGSLPFRNMWYHHGDPVVATSKLKVGRRTGVPLGLGEDLRKAKGRGSTWASLEDIGGRQCRIS